MGKAKSTVVNQGGGVYFLGMIASAVYFVQHMPHHFWWVVLALLKAIVWPVFVIYSLLGYLHVS